VPSTISTAPPRVRAQGAAARAHAGLDQRTREAQPGDAGDRDARELEQAVGHDVADEHRERARLDRQAGERAQQQAVVGERDQRAGAERQAAGERKEGDLDVVGEDRARERRLRGQPHRQVAHARIGGGAIGARDQADGGAGIVDRPCAGQQCGGEHGGHRDGEQRAMGAHVAPVATRGELEQRAGAPALAVDGVAGPQHERLEPFQDGVAGEAAAGQREIGDDRAVEPSELEHALHAQALGSAPATIEQSFQLLPGGGALA
jgi:hypothetical protein